MKTKIVVLLFIITSLTLPLPAADSLHVKERLSVPVNKKTDSAQIAAAKPDSAALSALRARDSLKAKHSADSIVADSLQKQKRYHLLDSLKTQDLDRYQRFPQRLDSLFNPFNVYPHNLFQADADGISDIFALRPSSVAIPFSLASQLNRFLWYGFLYPQPALQEINGAAGEASGEIQGSDFLCPAAIAQIQSSISSPLVSPVLFQLHPYELIIPQTSIFWENGVFGENILGVRFSRALSRSMQFSIAPQYRFMNGQSFSHDNGDINSFYREFIFDSTLVSNQGRNPKTQEQITAARLIWQIRPAWQAECSGAYADMQNEVAWEAVDPGDGNRFLVWDLLRQYRADLRLATTATLFSRLLLGAEARMSRGGDSRTASFDNIFTHPTLYGNDQTVSWAMRPGWLLGGDTLELSGHGTQTIKTRYNGLVDTAADAHLLLAAAHTFTDGAVSVTAGGRAGAAEISYNGSRKRVWCGTAFTQVEHAGQRARLFASQDAVSITPPYDSVPVAFDSLSPSVRSYGAEIMLTARRASLFIGYRAMRGPDSQTIALAWPQQIVPYAQPRNVWSIAPGFGRAGGFGLYSRYMISDTKPFLKAAAVLSYLRPIAHNHAHLQSDLSVNYWSARDKIAYGGQDRWNREIYDCDVHIAVQIKNFRLFYKMDNLLNRTIAYMPGYWMPGLTFRWGFSWIIAG